MALSISILPAIGAVSNETRPAVEVLRFAASGSLSSSSLLSGDAKGATNDSCSTSVPLASVSVVVSSSALWNGIRQIKCTSKDDFRGVHVLVKQGYLEI